MRRTVEIPHDPLDSRQFELVVKQLADALTYVMNSWGNDLGTVSREDVRRVRTAKP